jgi:xanthine dehydrogenase accessory factor
MVVYEDGRVEGSMAARPGSAAAELGSSDDGPVLSLGDTSATQELVAAAQKALAQGRSSVLVLGGRQLFIEAFPLRPRLVIVGGVPVAQSLARLARELGYEVVVIDARPSFATPERFPDVDQLSVGWPDEVAAKIDLGPADAVAVLSHDPKVDEPAILDALRRGCRYVGAIGSRKTQAARRARLLEAGLSEAQLQRLRGPIGLDLGGRTPAETALAIMAEVVAERYAASTRPMSAAGA